MQALDLHSLLEAATALEEQTKALERRLKHLEAGRQADRYYPGWIQPPTIVEGVFAELGSYAALRAYSGNLTTFYIRGVSNILDGGAGLFRIDTSDTTSADNGGTILVDVNGHRWKREFTGAVNVKWFGAAGDGVTDDTAGIQAAIDSGSKAALFPAGDYLVSSAISITNNFTVLIGAGHGTSRLIASADGVSVLNFASSTPTTVTLQNCAVIDLGIRVLDSVSSITSGVGVTLTNTQQCKFSNVQIEGFFGGLLLEGGGINFFDNLSINSGYNFGAARAGSYGLKSIAHDLGGGNYKNPAGNMISNFDIWNGGGLGYLDNAIVVESCDGLWFSNGHCGFTKSACVYISPTVLNNGNVGAIGLSFSQTHFDGSNGLTEYCVKYNWPVSFTGSIRRHSFTGCHAGNAKFDCYHIEGSSISEIAISGGRVNLASNSVWGVSIKDSSRIAAVGVVIDAFGSSGVTGGGVLLDGADFVKIDAVFDTLPTGLSITNNATRNNIEGVFKDCTNDIDTTGLSNTSNRVSGSTTNLTFAVASASDITLQLPHEVFSVTGTTTINTINAADTFQFRKVTLLFTGACAVTDGTIKLAGAFTSTAGSSLSLVYDGTSWVEVSRGIV